MEIYVQTGAHCCEKEVNVEQHWPTVCALILALSAESSSTVKPGDCPAPVGGGLCAEFCSYDIDCPGHEKCCSNGCGHQCKAPYTDDVPSVKPGNCPRSVGPGACVELCVNDSTCLEDQKCCSNGCGHQCMTPVTVKLGRCPLPQITYKCGKFCYHDGECEGEQKCCMTRCGHGCSDRR